MSILLTRDRNLEDAFASCADGNEDHVCLHGGDCVPMEGKDLYYCDCSNARDERGVPHVGKWCHIPPETYCGDDKSFFCVNQGSCVEGSSADGTMSLCSCLEGYVGSQCQFVKGDMSSISEEVDGSGSDSVVGNGSSNGDCSIHCQNGAKCEHDTTTSPGSYRCICPDGFEGQFCENVAIPCGPNGNVCHHGSSCLRTIHGEYACDCTSAIFIGGNDNSARKFAGRWCEYEATSYCDDEKQSFCVNGGECQGGDANDDAGYSCSCDETLWTGSMCEVPKEDAANQLLYEECTRTCLNGGNCRKTPQNDDNNQSPKSAFDQESSERCECPQGFTGRSCEYIYEECGNGDYFCLHGSTCVRDDKGENGWSCDCQLTSNGEDTMFAGVHCQHHETTVCTSDKYGNRPLMYDPRKSMTFCFNGGICTEIVEQGESYPACICQPGYTGPHCELLQSITNMQSSEGSEGNSAAILFVCFVLGILLVFIVMVFILRWRGLQLQKQQAIDGRIAKLHSHQSSSGQSDVLEEVHFDDEFDDEDMEDVELL
ncbi:EGF-like domain containing protein [Nitzschia inconspicua]|uniref:EGF-like domain containing protein n=1 Tax=Nitzschia inconspicua TaxID=303405 RepID=A0A9K3P8T6_9STRA|nr:EGF-like domain containing protein [Nitzschia inconspicua]KAG7338472.1 EGF-like domain containing protein [Nitzschia inconspicua]KAG7350735.1 EGF-like domain containing protein [Nitzschia inconspicua]